MFHLLTITGHAALSLHWVVAVGRWTTFPLTLDRAFTTNAHSTWVWQIIPRLPVSSLSAFVPTACKKDDRRAARKDFYQHCFVFRLLCQCVWTCTLARLATLLCDGVRARSKRAGLVLTVNRPVDAQTCSTAVSRVIEMLCVSVWPLLEHTVWWRIWRSRKISNNNKTIQFNLYVHLLRCRRRR